MIQWVYERARQAKLLDQVIVATDDQRIFNAVNGFGGSALMTSPAAANGTERVAEVARQLSSTLIVNIQGDEPAIDPEMIDQAIGMMQNHPEVPVGTLVKRINTVAELLNPNIPKVVLDKNSFALYFSRATIPFFRDIAPKDQWIAEQEYFQHIGLYIYRREFLLKFVSLPPSKLEKIEQLEQLRILENGYKIKAAVTESISIGVDIPEDITRVTAYLSGRVI